MSDKEGRPGLEIRVIGAFQVLTQDGKDLTPRGRKARALLALLALTPTRRRSRAALQDRLWSDRGPDQGAASLRQTLTEIRRALGERYRDILVSGLHGIGFAEGRVSVDIDTADLAELARATEFPELLDDLDVADPEFEHWLRDQRTAFEERVVEVKLAAIGAPKAGATDRPVAAASTAPFPLPNKPPISVLSFQNLSGDPEQKHFADGMLRELITVSHIHWLLVVARNSSFTYESQAVDARQVGEELSGRYLLEGSVHSAGSWARIIAQLVAAAGAAHPWADGIASALEDMLDEKRALLAVGEDAAALTHASTASARRSSAVSSPPSRRAPREPTAALSSPIWRAWPRRSVRRCITLEERPKT